jgi:putative proteasome-type protease
MPLDLAVIRRDTFAFETRRRIDAGDPHFAAISVAWSDALRHAFLELPPFGA